MKFNNHDQLTTQATTVYRLAIATTILHEMLFVGGLAAAAYVGYHFLMKVW